MNPNQFSNKLKNLFTTTVVNLLIGRDQSSVFKFQRFLLIFFQVRHSSDSKPNACYDVFER